MSGRLYHPNDGVYDFMAGRVGNTKQNTVSYKMKEKPIPSFFYHTMLRQNDPIIVFFVLYNDLR